MGGTERGKKPGVLPADDLLMCDWDAPILGEVITMSEACVMFGRSRPSIRNAVLTRKLDGRRSFTGGDWLITLESLIRKYGKPEKDVLTCLKN